MYRYLGCVVDDHLELKEMVEDKAAVGRKHLLGAWVYIVVGKKWETLGWVHLRSC